MFQRAQIIGKVIRDPETRFLPSGTDILDIVLKVTANRRPRAGAEPEDRGNFWEVTLFGADAKHWAGRGIQKGDVLYVDGDCEITPYQKKDKTLGVDCKIVGFTVRIDMSYGRTGDGDFRAAPDTSGAPIAPRPGAPRPEARETKEAGDDDAPLPF